MRLSRGLFTTLFFLEHRAVQAVRGTSQECTTESLVSHLASIDSPLARNATILSVTHVRANGSYGDPTALPGLPPMRPTGLPDLCAVEVNVTSSESSSYTFALFLPSRWEGGRFLAVGGGGTAGYVNYLDMAAGAHLGFATMSTDNGHRGSPFDVAWTYHSPERRVDWAWRAMHGSVRLGKRLVGAYYQHHGGGVRRSYYTGCSTGGRQGLKEAQVDAASFDGMLVGAPAWWVTHMVSWITKISKDYFPRDDPKSIPPDLFAAIGAAVTAQCDGADGVVDGIVSAPERCHPDFEVLSCDGAGADPSACLTRPQLGTLAKIYADYYVDDGDGGAAELAYPGLGLSSEAGWTDFLFGAAPLSYGLDYMRYAVLGDPGWPLAAYDDGAYARVLAADLGGPDPDDLAALAAYRDRGGRILMYHGLADPLITPRGSTHFYEQARLATATATAAGATTVAGAAPPPLEAWFRLFPVPGMLHCQGSAVGAQWHINGAGQGWTVGPGAYSVPGFQDPGYDALLALVEWVEHGRAVDRIVATAWHNLTDPGPGVSRQRPLCPYPRTAVYDGLGDVDQADSWDCE